jgi:hypothetical protein
MESSLESVAEMPKNVTEVDLHGTSDSQPVKADKSTRDRLKAGRASMFPSVLDPPSKRARLDLAVDAPLLPPMPSPLAGRNASSTSTFPGENQRPPAWSRADQGGKWKRYDSPYGQSYDDGSHYNESWHRESHRRPAPHYDDRRWEEHAPFPYNYQPSSPYWSNLYVPLKGLTRDALDRHQQASFMDNFQDFGAFQDVIRRKVHRVSLLYRKYKNQHP